MTPAGVRMLGKAASERLRGGRPGRGRAVAAAVVAGATTAVVTYRLLRSGEG
jgi:hypothetical protein